MIEARKGTEFGLQAHLILTKATLAQSVEQRIRNAQVASSSLVSGSKQKRDVSIPGTSLFNFQPTLLFLEVIRNFFGRYKFFLEHISSGAV